MGPGFLRSRVQSCAQVSWRCRNLVEIRHGLSSGDLSWQSWLPVKEFHGGFLKSVYHISSSITSCLNVWNYNWRFPEIGLSPVIIPSERWDFPLNKPSRHWGLPSDGVSPEKLHHQGTRSAISCFSWHGDRCRVRIWGDLGVPKMWLTPTMDSWQGKNLLS